MMFVCKTAIFKIFMLEFKNFHAIKF